MHGNIEWPSLLGPDKIKLLKKLSTEFGHYQPAEMAKDVEALWKVVTSYSYIIEYECQCSNRTLMIRMYTNLSSCTYSPSYDLNSEVSR